MAFLNALAASSPGTNTALQMWGLAPSSGYYNPSSAPTAAADGGGGYSGGAGGGASGGAAGGGAGVSGGPNRFDPMVSDAERRLKSLLDDPNSIQQSAAYKFRVGQGQEALQRSLGARGMLNSGNRLAELTKYGQDMGSQEYDAQFSRLSDLMKTGTTGYIGDRGASNQAQDIANRFSLGSEANLQNRQRMQAGQTTPSNGISNPWALPGYNGYNY